MKLVLCTHCQDVVRLVSEHRRECRCGRCGGFYTDEVNAVYWGDEAVPMGFSNPSLVYAIKNQPPFGRGKPFTAFIIPEDCETFVKCVKKS